MSPHRKRIETLAPPWNIDDDFAQAMASGAVELPGFLGRTARWIAQITSSDACAVYLTRSGDANTLVLTAVHGFDEQLVETVTVASGTGLVGRASAASRMRQAEGVHARPFDPAVSTEEAAVAVAVPIEHVGHRVGAFAVYRRKARRYTRDQVRLLREMGPRIDVAIQFVRMSASVPRPKAQAPLRTGVTGMFRGQSISSGYALGQARVFTRATAAHILEHRRLSGAETPSVRSLEEVVSLTARQLESAQQALAGRLPEAAAMLFESHLMMLQDEFFLARIRRGQDAGVELGRAIAEAAAEFIRIFERSEHEYVKEKARDVEDLALRLLENLDASVERPLSGPAGHIVVARELLPSDLLWIAQANVKGLVLVSGGSTAHISLLVRSLGIPLVIIRAIELLQIADGTDVLLDGATGTVLIDPPAEAIAAFDRHNLMAQASRHRQAMRDVTETADGCRVRLMANINLLSEVPHALELRAEGVGLYRTELLYLVRPDLPTEEDQQAVYSRLLDEMGGRPVTFRTLDAGGDKVLSFFENANEANPALGLRSTRFTLRHPEIFDRQLRAILRAANGREVRVMFPMIGSLDEWRTASRRFGRCAAAVAEESGLAHRVRLGMMVELPAVVDLASDFAAETAFFSIGTNDFIQYMLGVDRTNESVASYYCPHHPSVLRGLQRVVAAAREKGVGVSVCGEMAHDTRYVPFFVGIGIRELSVEPNHLPSVQAAIAALTLTEAEEYAAALLEQPTIAAVETCLIKPA